MKCDSGHPECAWAATFDAGVASGREAALEDAARVAKERLCTDPECPDRMCEGKFAAEAIRALKAKPKKPPDFEFYGPIELPAVPHDGKEFTYDSRTGEVSRCFTLAQVEAAWACMLETPGMFNQPTPRWLELFRAALEEK